MRGPPAGQNAPEKRQLVCRTYMVHYLDVQARSPSAYTCTAPTRPPFPLPPPSRPTKAVLDFSSSVPVQRLGGQQGVASREQLVWKCEQAPLLCVQAMLLEWLAEPRVGVLMDLGRIPSRLPAILAYTPAAAPCPASLISLAEASQSATPPAAAAAWSCCWRCTGCWAAYRRAVRFAAFLVLVARSPHLVTLWKAHMDSRAATFTALLTELGARRHAQPDCFASMLVQVLGVKERADLQEGFGFFLQHLLPGTLDTAGGKAQGTRKKAAALGNAGPVATAAVRLMGGGRGAEGIGGSSAGRGSGDEEDGGEGDGGRQGPVGGGGEGGGDGHGGQWRKHLKGRVWERYVDGMAWILQHGGGKGREFRCSHCSEEGTSSSTSGDSGSRCSSAYGGDSSSSNGGSSSGGDVVGSGKYMGGRDVPRGMYVSGVGATDFALAVASVLSLPGHYEDQSLMLDGNNAAKAKVENAAIRDSRSRLRKRAGDTGRASGGSGATATDEAAGRPNPLSKASALNGSGTAGIGTRAASTCSSPCHLSSTTTSSSTTHALPPAAAPTAPTFDAPQESTAAAQSRAILTPGLVPVNTHPAMALLTYRVACMLQWVRIYGSDFIPKNCCSRDSLQGKVLPMRHPFRDLPSLLLRFSAIPKPVEGSDFPLEWEEWPEGDDAAAKFPHDPTARFFGLGIVETSAMGDERGSQHGLSEETEVVEECDVTEAGGQGPSEYVQRAAGKGKAVKGIGKRGKGGYGSGGKKAEWGPETITERGKGKGVLAQTTVLPPPRHSKDHSQPWLPIMRCRADVDFLLAFLPAMLKVPKCSHCLKFLGIFMNHVPCCALIANFAYRPVDALVTRFLSAFPAHSPQFDQLLKALLLRSPLTVAEHIRLINESSPAGVRLGMSALRHECEQMTELPKDAGMRKSVMRFKARQMPLFFLLGVVLYHAKPIMGVSDKHDVGSHSGDMEMIARRIERVMGSGGSVGGVDSGEVWVEVEAWCCAMMCAWRSSTKVMGSGLHVSCGKGSSHVLPTRAGAPMSHEWGVDMWAQAAKPRFRDDMRASRGGCGDACADSNSGVSGGGGGKSEGEEGKGEVPGYLNPWPGGVNLLACLREMLLGKVCYRPASPAASCTHPAAPSVSVSTRPVPSSAPAAPITARAPSNAAASVSVAQCPGDAACIGYVCGAAGCGRVEGGGGVKLRNC
ncbi:unnamed protein product [Closterium sp. NIES-65]|nr:unnamed protein product [Closterium sp. NIES-65]